MDGQNTDRLKEKLIEVKNLKTHFFLDEGVVKAIDGVSFDIYRGETLGIVGESGCGKSVTARSILRIVEKPGRIVSGEILFHHKNENGFEEIIDVSKLKKTGNDVRRIRGKEISMIFQEPMTSLSPVYTIGNQMIEGMKIHSNISKEQLKAEAIDMLNEVGMSRPDRVFDQYPFELSGGMRQRAMIAMALSCHPSLLLADEPTTALDVTTQAQILEVMRLMKERLGMGIVMITHDLGVVAEMTERVVVMYLGQVVEVASVHSLFHEPLHPYTEGLMQSIPKLGKTVGQRLMPIKGMVPNPYDRPKGCLFHPRCPKFIAGRCDETMPKLVEVEPGHFVSCLLFGDVE